MPGVILTRRRTQINYGRFEAINRHRIGIVASTNAQVDLNGPCPTFIGRKKLPANADRA